jgi:predicted anti-sigma-YlaC factor YlaD
VVGRPTDVLSCYRARRRLGAYLDGALGEADVRWTERHLAGCATCQGEVGQLRRVKALVAEAAAIPEPDWTGFFPGIVRGIQDKRTGAVPPRAARARRLWPQWAMGGAALATVALTFVLWQGGRVPVSAEAGVLVNAADTEHPGATVMVYTAPEKDLAVVWVFDSDPD